MRKILFSKLVATGNDFIVIKEKDVAQSLRRYAELALAVCSRSRGIGADGLLVISSSKKADFKMRIFNADGSEAEMCGNGARAAAFFVNKKHAVLETKAGIIQSVLSDDEVKIRLTDPLNIKLDSKISLCNRPVVVHSINTGVPHAVIFVSDVSCIDVNYLGRIIRNHKNFGKAGTNVNFVQLVGLDEIAVRTYERGVEAETLACGTGSTASALISVMKLGIGKSGLVKVHTAGKDTLTIYFRKINGKFSDVWLRGPVARVCKGEYYV